jgi:hypothetical protein
MKRIREGQIAVQLDPVSSAGRSALGRILYRARRYEEALPHLRRAVERSLAALQPITVWVMSTLRWAGMIKPLLHMRKQRADFQRRVFRGRHGARLCA